MRVGGHGETGKGAVHRAFRKYPAKLLRHAAALLKEMHIPCGASGAVQLAGAAAEVEKELIPAADEAGLGTVVFRRWRKGC